MIRKARQTAHWASLIKYVDWLITSVNESIENSVDDDDRSHSVDRDLLGLCYQLRAMIHMRIAQCYHDLMGRLMNSTSASSPDASGGARRDSMGGDADVAHKLRDLTTLTSKYFKTQGEATADFRKGFRELPVERVRLGYPKTWNNREASGSTGGSRPVSGFRPLEDSYALPLHVYSSLQEATAFACRVLREWAYKNGIEYDSVLTEGHQSSS